MRKADPNLYIQTVTGVVYSNGRLEISINKETVGEKLNITIIDKDGAEYKYTEDIPADGLMTYTTPITLDKYNEYHFIVEYGGNANFAPDRDEYLFTPSKIYTFGINITVMNITVGDDEIITVEVPDHADDVVMWVNGVKYRNT